MWFLGIKLRSSDLQDKSFISQVIAPVPQTAPLDRADKRTLGNLQY